MKRTYYQLEEKANGKKVSREKRKAQFVKLEAQISMVGKKREISSKISEEKIIGIQSSFMKCKPHLRNKTLIYQQWLLGSATESNEYLKAELLGAWEPQDS